MFINADENRHMPKSNLQTFMYTSECGHGVLLDFSIYSGVEKGIH